MHEGGEGGGLQTLHGWAGSAAKLPGWLRYLQTHRHHKLADSVASFAARHLQV